MESEWNQSGIRVESFFAYLTHLQVKVQKVESFLEKQVGENKFLHHQRIILPALSNDIAPRLGVIKRDLAQRLSYINLFEKPKNCKKNVKKTAKKMKKETFYWVLLFFLHFCLRVIQEIHTFAPENVKRRWV